MKYLLPITLSVVFASAGAFALARLHKAQFDLPPQVRETIYNRPLNDSNPTDSRLPPPSKTALTPHPPNIMPRPLPERAKGERRPETTAQNAPSPEQTSPQPATNVTHSVIQYRADPPTSPQKENLVTWVTGVFR